MPGGISRQLIVLALAGASVLGGIAPAQGASAPRERVTLCGQYQHLRVSDQSGRNFMIRNDNYGGQRECVTNIDRRPNFAVTLSRADSDNGKPVAFPYIFLGCSWGLCTTGTTLPRRVSALRDPVTSWSTIARAGGSWNAAYDIWFSRKRVTGGQATGGELMIWLNSRALPRQVRQQPAAYRAPVVWVEHARYYLLSWITGHDGRRWRLIQFRRVRPVSGVTGLRLMPFIKIAQRNHWISRSAWLMNVEAGFEIWDRGTGLTTTSFSARA